MTKATVTVNRLNTSSRGTQASRFPFEGGYRRALAVNAESASDLRVWWQTSKFQFEFVTGVPNRRLRRGWSKSPIVMCFPPESVSDSRLVRMHKHSRDFSSRMKCVSDMRLWHMHKLVPV